MKLGSLLGLATMLSFSAGAASADSGCEHTIEYLIICEAQYWEQAYAHSCAIRSNPAHGSLNTSIYTLDDIENMYGMADSTRTRQAISDLWDWSECLKYVLLIGSRVPTYKFVPRKAVVKRWNRTVCYDDPYGDVDDDGELEVAIGRVNCSSSVELTNWSNKVQEMLAADPDDPVQRKALVLAEDGMINDEDGAYVREWADRIVGSSLPSYLTEKTAIFATDVDPYLDPQNLQEYVLPIFNQGYGLVIGVGTYSSAFDFVDFFSTQYANLSEGMLTNAGKYPIVLGFCCETARWDTSATFRSVMDLMNLADSAGTTLWIGPTACTVQSQTRIFLDQILERVFWTEGYRTWGEVFKSAKNRLQCMLPIEHEIWWEYGLFGEPSLPIRCGCGMPAAIGDSATQLVPPTLLVAGNPVRLGPARIVLTSPEQVSLKVGVYDVTGRMVAHLLDGSVRPGRTIIEWDGLGISGRRVSPGIYIVRIHGPGGGKSAKIAILH